jgi:hypothetical protein
MAYTYKASLNTVRRIDNAVRKMENDSQQDFKITLANVNALIQDSGQSHFNRSLDHFLDENPNLKEAFKYEGWSTGSAFFGKWCQSKEYDVTRSQEILTGLSIALTKRVQHLTKEKATVLKKMDGIVKSINKKNEGRKGVAKLAVEGDEVVLVGEKFISESDLQEQWKALEQKGRPANNLPAHKSTKALAGASPASSPKSKIDAASSESAAEPVSDKLPPVAEPAKAPADLNSQKKELQEKWKLRKELLPSNCESRDIRKEIRLKRQISYESYDEFEEYCTLAEYVVQLRELKSEIGKFETMLKNGNTASRKSKSTHQAQNKNEGNWGGLFQTYFGE